MTDDEKQPEAVTPEPPTAEQAAEALAAIYASPDWPTLYAAAGGAAGIEKLMRTAAGGGAEDESFAAYMKLRQIFPSKK